MFHKSSVLYALDRAQASIRKAGEALLMEGYTDVLMAHMEGFDRAVAGMGTALTDRQAATLRRFSRTPGLLVAGVMGMVALGASSIGMAA